MDIGTIAAVCSIVGGGGVVGFAKWSWPKVRAYRDKQRQLDLKMQSYWDEFIALRRQVDQVAGVHLQAYKGNLVELEALREALRALTESHWALFNETRNQLAEVRAENARLSSIVDQLNDLLGEAVAASQLPDAPQTPARATKFPLGDERNVKP